MKPIYTVEIWNNINQEQIILSFHSTKELAYMCQNDLIDNFPNLYKLISVNKAILDDDIPNIKGAYLNLLNKLNDEALSEMITSYPGKNIL